MYASVLVTTILSMPLAGKLVVIKMEPVVEIDVSKQGPTVHVDALDGTSCKKITVHVDALDWTSCKNITIQ